jgi:hypothetical protein
MCFLFSKFKKPKSNRYIIIICHKQIKFVDISYVYFLNLNYFFYNFIWFKTRSTIHIEVHRMYTQREVLQLCEFVLDFRRTYRVKTFFRVRTIDLQKHMNSKSLSNTYNNNTITNWTLSDKKQYKMVFLGVDYGLVLYFRIKGQNHQYSWARSRVFSKITSWLYERVETVDW